MKIKLEKSGGFAGVIRRVEVDVDNLDELEKNQIKRLIDECNIHSSKHDAKDNTIPRGSADYIVYKISMIHGRKEVNAKFSEYTLNKSHRDLLNRLMRFST